MHQSALLAGLRNTAFDISSIISQLIDPEILEGDDKSVT